jgi:hypothetical protein
MFYAIMKARHTDTIFLCFHSFPVLSTIATLGTFVCHGSRREGRARRHDGTSAVARATNGLGKITVSGSHAGSVTTSLNDLMDGTESWVGNGGWEGPTTICSRRAFISVFACFNLIFLAKKKTSQMATVGMHLNQRARISLVVVRMRCWFLMDA